ncbi:MAG: methyl-accepting chemotaxis protein [Anaerolineae bacterium]|nr:methyl-accepting chemotaxis protein [Anaerolineae bacterium]
MQQAQPSTTELEQASVLALPSGFFNSLQRKLMLALLLLGIVPLVIMVVLSYVQTRGVLRDSVESELRSVANLTDDRVERWLDAREVDAKTFSSLQFLAGDAENALNLGLEVMVSAEGQAEGAIAQQAARDAIPQILDATGAIYSAIYITDLNGRVIIGYQNEIVGSGDAMQMTIAGNHHEGHVFQRTDRTRGDTSPPGPEELILQARQAAEQTGTGFYRSPILAYEFPETDAVVNTIFVAHLVEDAASGNPVGGIILEVSEAEIRSLTENFSGGDGRTYLQSGNFLVSGDAVRPLPEADAVQRANSSGVDRFEGFFSDETVLGSWQGNPTADYVVYAQIPTADAFSDLENLGILLAVVAALAVVFVSIFSVIVARQVTKPVSNLIKAARQIAEGSLETQVLVDSQDEIGMLASTFNDMTEKLRVRVYEETRDREYLENVLTSYMKFVERVSRGDLTARLSLNGQTGANLIVANVDMDRDDNLLRLGYNLNRMVEALHSMASQTRDVAGSLSEAAAEIMDTSNRQISSTTQQDASVSQTTSTVAEIRATVAETAERAQMVAEAAQQSVEISRQGQRAVAETIEGMNVIRSRVESIAENILMLSERTTQIGDIIATVNAIADQSKMLALNASIEAAAQAKKGAALPWSPPRSVTWRNKAAKPPPRSAISSAKFKRPPIPPSW